MPIPLMWDGATDGDDSGAWVQKCVSGTPAAFAYAASVLFEYAKRFPDRGLNHETDRMLFDVNHEKQSLILQIAHQLMRFDNPCYAGENPGGEMSFMLRQNPFNACQLQQSINGGITWTLAYDFTLCEAIAGDSSYTVISNNFYQQMTNIVQEYYNDYTANYTDSVTDLYPDLGYGDPDDEFRDTALCHAIDQFIDMSCEALLKEYDEFETQADNIKLAASLAAGIAALFGLATGGTASAPLAALAAEATLWAAGIALGATLGEALYTTILNNNREIFEDLDARKQVRCAMYNILKGANVDQDDFAGSLSGLTFTGNAEGVAAYLSLLLAEPATYATFLPVYQQNLLSAKAGILLPCDCSTYTAYVVGILSKPPGVIAEYGFEDEDILTIPAYQDNAQHWHIPLKLPAGNWQVELIDFDPVIPLPQDVYPYNSFESAWAYHAATSGTFNNQTWDAGGDPQLIGTKNVTNNIFAPWGASQDWAWWVNAGEPFTVQIKLTLLP